MATRRGRQPRGTQTDYATTVANAIIEQLQAGTAPWQKPWVGGQDRFMPYNPKTGKSYRGANAVYLWAVAMDRGYSDSRWMTYNQAKEMGAQVRRGEHGTPIQYTMTSGREAVRDDKGNPVVGTDGKQRMRDVEYDRPRTMHFTVFNASQIEGLPEAFKRPATSEWERHAQAERVLVSAGVEMRHVAGSGAYYDPSADRITMPLREQFPTADGYYAVALHELGHASGHPSRLNRDLSNRFGTPGYAKEELRAEIASMMLGDELGIGHDPGEHASYVQSWIKVLQDDPREIFRASADAEKIKNYVLDLARDKALDQVAETPVDLDEDQATQLLSNWHESRVAGNDPFATWNNLRDSAAEMDLSTTLRVSEDENKLAVLRVDYTDAKSGQGLGVHSLIWENGKALTMVAGERVPGSFPSAYHDTQKQDLTFAVDEAKGKHAGNSFVDQAHADKRAMLWVMDVLEASGPNISFDDLGLSRERDGRFTAFKLGETHLASLNTDGISRKALVDALYNNIHELRGPGVPQAGNAFSVYDERSPEFNSRVRQHAMAMDVLHGWHESANEGYSPLESFHALQTAATAQGLTAYTQMQGVEDFGAIRVNYARNGVELPVETRLGSDGKGATFVNDVRVPHTYMSSDLETLTNDLRVGLRLASEYRENDSAKDSSATDAHAAARDPSFRRATIETAMRKYAEQRLPEGEREVFMKLLRERLDRDEQAGRPLPQIDIRQSARVAGSNESNVVTAET